MTEKKSNAEKIQVTCEMEVTLKMIGGKYKILILNYLLENGKQRFGELKSLIPSISQRTLTNQLRELEADDLIVRTAYPTIPPKVEYSISENGMTLKPVLLAMCNWGAEHAGEKYEITCPQCNGEDC